MSLSPNTDNPTLRLALVTDAWQPQINGVVRTWQTIIDHLERDGHEVHVVHPLRFKTVPCPGYPSIPLAMRPGGKLRRVLDRIRPQAIHIATEGPVGLAGRAYCRKRGLPFTTSYHTQFPQYLKMYFGLPTGPTYALIRWFHNAAAYTLVPTESVQEQLAERGFHGVVVWERGVDCELFRPDRMLALDLPRPVLLFVGRVAREKTLDDLCALDLPGSKVIVGDGPDLNRLLKKFPETIFTGPMHGEQLAAYYAASDVLVFPSRTDTFGNSMLEAMACGTPVAAYPVTGPIDLIQPGVTGVMHEELKTAVEQALRLRPDRCREYALTRSWPAAAKFFLEHLQPIAPAAVA